jgi:putative aldouronate transport system permease protein
MFLIALPLLALVFVFYYLPLYGWVYAFVNYKPGHSVFNMEFAGLKHFKMIFEGGTAFKGVMGNTLALSGLNLACAPIPVVFAIMLSRAPSRGFSKIVQTVSSLPNFISWILVYSFFFSMFSNSGLFNQLLVRLGATSQSLNALNNPGIAWYFQTFIGIWKNTGWSAIIYIAAISGIDQELYDAADVDGAGSFGKIIHVTVPGLMPTFFVLLVLAMANILNNGFDQYYVFRNALTASRLEVLDTYVYRLGIMQGLTSLSVAVGMSKSLVSILLLTVLNVFSKRVRGESIF